MMIFHLVKICQNLCIVLDLETTFSAAFFFSILSKLIVSSCSSLGTRTKPGPQPIHIFHIHAITVTSQTSKE